MAFDFSIEPWIHLKELLQLAESKGNPDPTAMVLSTVNEKHEPLSRVVLCKDISQNGIQFFTNYLSLKSNNINAAPCVAVNFFWPEIKVQIRVLGFANKISRKDSENYFSTRPRLSQLGAWASDQSQKISNIQELNDKLKKVAEKYEGKNVPCPNNWGGFLIQPYYFEFWFAKDGRLHERYVYEKSNDLWTNYMLSP